MADANNDTFIEIEEFEDHFARVPKYALSDIKLTLKAKGLYAYLSALPKNWKLYRSQMLKHVADGKDSLNTAFKELEAFGYLTSTPIREKGQFKGYKLKVMIKPIEQPLRKNRNGETVTGETASGKSATNKINSKEIDSTSLSNDNDCIPPIDLFASLPPEKQPQPKEKVPKKRKVADWHPFEESKYFDIEYLTQRLASDVNFASVNIIFYHQAAKVWSDKGNNQKNWLAAIQGFILSDIKKKELVTNDHKDVLSGVNDFSKYLTETLNG